MTLCNIQAIVFGIISNKKFDMIIMGFIMLNMIAMMCDHFNMSNAWKFALDNANLGYERIFLCPPLKNNFFQVYCHLHG